MLNLRDILYIFRNNIVCIKRRKIQETVNQIPPILGTRVLDKEKYKNDEENENVKDKASTTVEYGIFVRAVEQIKTELILYLYLTY